MKINTNLQMAPPEGITTYVYRNAHARYFEERDTDSFLERLKGSLFPIEYLSESGENDWGRRVVRIYNPDRHVLEVGELRSNIF